MAKSSKVNKPDKAQYSAASKAAASSSKGTPSSSSSAKKPASSSASKTSSSSSAGKPSSVSAPQASQAPGIAPGGDAFGAAPTPLAGRYAGAAPAVSLGNRGGMSEIMARAVQANPSQYPGYANPYGGGRKKGY